MFGNSMSYYSFFDPTYIFIIIGLVISVVASINVNGSFKKYKKIKNRNNYTAEQAAEIILKDAGVYDVTIMKTSGSFTDHYDPRSKTVNLSDSVYGSRSLSAVGVAAHECGHAIQHANLYSPLSMRTAILPAASIGSKISIPLIVVGFIFSFIQLVYVGIVLFSLALLFQVVTLPVEFNASKRALLALKTNSILYDDETAIAKKVLRAAALTYVAAVIVTALQLLRLILLANRRS
ncbi:MAG: zinc metallopeptidase [Lachnoclostridium sp.]|jgi:Zn-dependent membrane protease YugP|nr:zinc metallopeptidase [Lachnoclostridium sp.]